MGACFLLLHRTAYCEARYLDDIGQYEALIQRHKRTTVFSHPSKKNGTFVCKGASPLWPSAQSRKALVHIGGEVCELCARETVTLLWHYEHQHKAEWRRLCRKSIGFFLSASRLIRRLQSLNRWKKKYVLELETQRSLLLFQPHNTLSLTLSLSALEARFIVFFFFF